MTELSEANSHLNPSMKVVIRLLVIACVSVFVIFWFGGIASHLLFGGVDNDKNWIGSLFLLLTGLILFLTCRESSEVILLAKLALFGFIVEAIGVYTGFPFGSYNYSDKLGLQIVGVPIVMAFAWMTLILYVKEITLPFKLPRLPESIIGGLLVTCIDLLIDPVAVNQLGYWHWTNVGNYYNIPFTNFAGWFLTGFAAFYLFRPKSEPNPKHFLLGFSIVLFFTLLALIHGIYLPAFIGCLICVPYPVHIYNENSKKKG